MTPGLSWRALAALVVSLALAACAHAPREPHASPPRPLASLDAAGERAVSQVVRGAVGSREVTLNCVVSLQQGTMKVVGLNAMGVRLFTLSHDGKQPRVEKAPGVPEALTADRLLADLQLVYWPLPSLQQALRPAGYELLDTSPGTRRLRRGSTRPCDRSCRRCRRPRWRRRSPPRPSRC